MAADVYTLITGASEGLGKSYVIECATRNMHIIGVALPGPELASLQEYVRRNFPVQMEIIEVDLSSEAGCKHVYDTVRLKGLRVNMLINNAGVVITRPFHELPIEDALLQANINVVGTMLLTKYFINELLAHSPAYLLNVSSLGAFFHLPNKQMYGASKAFVYSFTRSLQAEYRHRDISITVVCPGGLSSNIRSIIANNQGGWVARQSITTPEFVAAKSVQACFDRKEVVIPGRLNRFFVFLNRLLPSSVKAKITTAQMRQLTVKARKEEVAHVKEK